MSQETHQHQANCDGWSPYTFIVSQAKGQREQPRYFYKHFICIVSISISTRYFYKHFICIVSIIKATKKKGVIIPFYRWGDRGSEEVSNMFGKWQSWDWNPRCLILKPIQWRARHQGVGAGDWQVFPQTLLFLIKDYLFYIPNVTMTSSINVNWTEVN